MGQAIKKLAFEKMGVERLIALIEPGNEPSERVALRLNMRLEKEVIRPGGGLRKVYVITAGDHLNFVFGLADREGRRAVIALPRLREEYYGTLDPATGHPLTPSKGAAQVRSLFLARAAKEAVHELGHTYGLGHCRDPRCVMAFSNSLADTDYKGQDFCAWCQVQIKPRGG